VQRNDEVGDVLEEMIGNNPYEDLGESDQRKQLERALNREQDYRQQQDKPSKKEAGFRVVHYPPS